MKTITEKAGEMWHEEHSEIDHNEYEGIFRNGVEYAQRWIPVTEELPEIGESVIIKNAMGFVGVGEWTGGRWKRWIWYSCESVTSLTVRISKEVTHWRPIEIK